MTTQPLVYAVVTPARNEAERLETLGACLAAQSVPPGEWMIVDQGSDDETHAVARRLAGENAWTRVVRLGKPPPQARGGPIVQALNAGISRLGARFDVVAKVDADVSFEPDYFERLLAAFRSDSSLGIVSGACYEEEDGTWIRRYGTGGSVWGAARAYRAACLEDVLPFEERMGWDGIDVVRAHLRGWTTTALLDVPFRHHRPEGQRDGARRRAWATQGRTAHYMGYRPSYLLARAFHRARRDPAALAMLWGYALAGARREPRCPDDAVRTFLREQQRIRHLSVRAREALGRPTA